MTSLLTFLQFQDSNKMCPEIQKQKMMAKLVPNRDLSEICCMLNMIRIYQRKRENDRELFNMLSQFLLNFSFAMLYRLKLEVRIVLYRTNRSIYKH